MANYFEDFDFTDFWEDSGYAKEKYTEEAPSDELIASVEQELGYKLPASYIWLMKRHNGGIPVNTCFPTEEPTEVLEGVRQRGYLIVIFLVYMDYLRLPFRPAFPVIQENHVEEKGYFALHADEDSYRLYDIQFWLYTNAHPGVAEQACNRIITSGSIQRYAV